MMSLKNLREPLRSSAALVAALWTLLLIGACSGTDGGLHGDGVIARNDAERMLLDAQLVRTIACGADPDDVDALVRSLQLRPRRVLDGAYYAIVDVERCVGAIYLTPCGQMSMPCNMSPKEWYEPGYGPGAF